MPAFPATTPMSAPALPADPIIGMWTCFGNAGGDRTELLYTFFVNNTWTRLDRNLQDRTKHNSRGTWTNGGNNQYQMKFSSSSGTFQYDTVKDEFYDTFYQCTFRRTADTGSSVSPAPVINLTLNSELKTPKLEKKRPLSGRLFLLVNVTIRNINASDGYPMDEKSIHVRYDDSQGSIALNSKFEGTLENPLRFGTLAPGETRQGNVILSVPADSSSYTLTLMTSRGDDASNSITFVNRSV